MNDANVMGYLVAGIASLLSLLLVYFNVRDRNNKPNEERMNQIERDYKERVERVEKQYHTQMKDQQETNKQLQATLNEINGTLVEVNTTLKFSHNDIKRLDEDVKELQDIVFIKGYVHKK